MNASNRDKIVAWLHDKGRTGSRDARSKTGRNPSHRSPVKALLVTS